MEWEQTTCSLVFPERPKEVAGLVEQVAHATDESRKPWCEMQTQNNQEEEGELWQ